MTTKTNHQVVEEDDHMLLISHLYPSDVYTQIVPQQGASKPKRRRKKSKSGEAGGAGLKKRKLTAEQVNLLELNFGNEHKLESEKKDRLASELGLDPRQVAVWFQNRRARWKNKKLEEEYSNLKKEHDSTVSENRKLESENISSEWTFLTASFLLEIFSAACEQLSSRNKPLYAQGGLLFAIAAFLICIWDLLDKVIKDRIVSPRNTPCFNLADYYGLAGAVYQLFSATFEWFHVRKGVDNPIKFSIMPLVFLVLLACSRARVERYTIDETLEDIV